MAPPNGNNYESRSNHSEDDVRASHEGSPWRKSHNSPSFQLLLEMRQQSENYERELRARLDQQSLEQERIHLQALAAAQAEHDRVRESAERTQLRIQLEREKERLQREEDERQAIDQERREQIDREIANRRREFEAQKRLEDQKRIAKQAEAEAEQLRLQREKEDREREEKARELEQEQEAEQEAELQRRQQEEETARKTAQSAKSVQDLAPIQPPAPAPPQPPQTLPSTSNSELVTPMPTREATHQRYLALHQQLKETRSFITQQGKQNPELKKRLGEMRRELRKCVGQLTGEKGANRIPINRIRTILQEAKTVQQPFVDAKTFILSQAGSNLDASQSQISGLFIYLLNIFSKAVISQFIDEAGVAPKAADPIGVVAISIFAAADFRWQDASFIDILIAKYHKVCPVLFGIYGSEKTEQGRKRLGWYFDKDSGSWIGEQRHGERMTGLGAGYAALTLRDFKKSASINPYPPVNYWRAIACIVNTPPQETTPTHFIVLKALVELNVPRFIGFYGQAAIVALRKAIVEFPRTAPKSVAATALTTLVPTLKRDAHLTLDT